MPIREQLKIALIKSNTSLTEVARQMNQKSDSVKVVSLQSLTRKINSGTLRYNDAEKIADVLGYKIKWVKNTKSDEGRVW